MNKTVHPFDIVTKSTKYSYQYPAPGKCPVCDVGTDAEVLSSFSVETKTPGVHHVFTLFFCHSCESCFIGLYRSYPVQKNVINNLSLLGYTPRSQFISSFSDSIQQLSPKFVEIYNQSEKAEQWGLNEICGMGYRKALEFLIKDFAISISPDKEDDIKSKLLKPCIDTYIENDKIKDLAIASAWLGNDETHYTRKHEDYSVEHLKKFISSTVAYIDLELNYMDACNLINHGN